MRDQAQNQAGTIALEAHSAHPANHVAGVACDYRFAADGAWSLTFTARIDPAFLRLPEHRVPERMDNLWQTTCFEMFVMQRACGHYREFNFAPSGSWACYDFTAYRQGQSRPPCDAPLIKANASKKGRFELTITGGNLAFAGRGDYAIALTAVIEEISGHKSYWALHHPDPDKPDFHHPDCFTLQL